MLPRIEPTISSSVLSKALFLAVLEDIVPASCCTLKPKEEGAPLRSTRTWLPPLCPDLLTSLSPGTCGGGRNGE